MLLLSHYYFFIFVVVLVKWFIFTRLADRWDTGGRVRACCCVCALVCVDCKYWHSRQSNLLCVAKVPE